MLKLLQFHRTPVTRIRDAASRLRAESASQLRERTHALRQRALSGTKPAKLLESAQSLVFEAIRRVLGVELYTCQLVAGAAMARGQIVEMETGEGKTLAATVPLYLHALWCRGSHLATSNDYLAQRDAEQLGPVYDLLGITCGFVSDRMDDSTRRLNYAKDITYGSITQFGFDFLRDRLKQRFSNQQTDWAIESDLAGVQRELHFLLADEADAVLIDEANTPMIIGAPAAESSSLDAAFQWAASVAPQAIEHRHFRYGLRNKSVELTPEGRTWARRELAGTSLSGISILELYEKLERAINVHRDFRRDQHYIVRDGQLVVVNDTTGRLGEGREWQNGIHQAIQAIEGLPISSPGSHAARLTTQGLALSYRFRAGMTGTAQDSKSELKNVYQLRTQRVPPRITSRRTVLPAKYFLSEHEKWHAVADEIEQMNSLGRPVLAGTRSLQKSERLASHLAARGLRFQLLNAREHQREAKIVASAGKRSAITVATNMAGRGTDIRLAPECVPLGGLHVILCELHDSRRQDFQLIGRCGRQGAPGTHRLFVSLDDEILELGFGLQRANSIRAQQPMGNQTELLRHAQQLLEIRKRNNRMAALHHEKRRLRALWEMGCDPLLDVI